MNQLHISEKAALQAILEAIKVLAIWTNSDKLSNLIATSNNEDVIKTVVTAAQDLLSWNSNDQPQALHLLFDLIAFNKNQAKKEQIQKQRHYYQPDFISDRYPKIPYPVTQQPSSEDFRKLQQ